MNRQRNDFIRDLIADIRFCDRCIAKGVHVDDNTRYRARCVRDLQTLLPKRHTFSFNQYGYPNAVAMSRGIV